MQQLLIRIQRKKVTIRRKKQHPLPIHLEFTQLYVIGIINFQLNPLLMIRYLYILNIDSELLTKHIELITWQNYLNFVSHELCEYGLVLGYGN